METKGECGCLVEEVVFTYSTGQSGIKPQISYCPLHKAASDMYEALKLYQKHQQGTSGHYCWKCAEAINKALAEANSK